MDATVRGTRKGRVPFRVAAREGARTFPGETIGYAKVQMRPRRLLCGCNRSQKRIGFPK